MRNFAFSALAWPRWLGFHHHDYFLLGQKSTKTCRQDCCGLAFKITATRALSKLLVCVVSRA